MGNFLCLVPVHQPTWKENLKPHSKPHSKPQFSRLPFQPLIHSLTREKQKSCSMDVGVLRAVHLTSNPLCAHNGELGKFPSTGVFLGKMDIVVPNLRRGREGQGR